MRIDGRVALNIFSQSSLTGYYFKFGILDNAFNIDKKAATTVLVAV